MSDKEFLGDLKRAKEEEYFHRKELELKERLRQRAAEAAEKQVLAEELGVKDDEALALLLELGYDHETVRLLHLMPLIEVAWADGVIAAAKRQQLLELAWARGVAKGSEAEQRLLAMLDRRPRADAFESALRAIRMLLGAQPEERRSAARNDLVKTATQIAEASHGLFGFGHRISEDEHAILSKLAGALAEDHQAATERQLTRTHD